MSPGQSLLKEHSQESRIGREPLQSDGTDLSGPVLRSRDRHEAETRVHPGRQADQDRETLEGLIECKRVVVREVSKAVGLVISCMLAVGPTLLLLLCRGIY